MELPRVELTDTELTDLMELPDVSIKSVGTLRESESPTTEGLECWTVAARRGPVARWARWPGGPVAPTGRRLVGCPATEGPH